MTDSLNHLSNIGPKTSDKLARLGITTPLDLVHHYPVGYQTYISKNINEIIPNEFVFVHARLIKYSTFFKNGKSIQIAQISDHTGDLTIYWFNQIYLSKYLKTGHNYNFSGKTSYFNGKLILNSPKINQVSAGTIPIYPQTKGITSTQLSKLITCNLDTIISSLDDPIPLPLQKKFNLISLKQALHNIHVPTTPDQVIQATDRLTIDELLPIQLQSLFLKQHHRSLHPKKIFSLSPKISKSIKKLIKSLPFSLTKSQKTVWKRLLSSLIDDHVLNGLLIGDVGSGKTILAILSAYLAYLNNSSTIIIAPTQILAKQHYQTFLNFLPRQKKSISLLTSKSAKTKLTKKSIIISTHAVFFHQDKLPKFDLVIIDEQHKFGVDQRQKLLSKQSPPHLLTMTATPIPRTAQLALLGNIDVFTLKSKPKNRLPVKTFCISQTKEADCYTWLKQKILNEHIQAFIVCPFIDESESKKSVKAANSEFQKLSTSIFSELKTELVTGKTKSDDQKQIFDRFSKGQIDILFTTPIIEVGIDFPNAAAIIIQSAERFGLAQLHQLRGRVGRGNIQSFCVLVNQNPESASRLDFISSTNNAFEIAKYDLKSRGPGTLFSSLQHGFPNLKLANLNDMELVQKTKDIATDLIDSGLDLKKLFPDIKETNFN